MADTSLTPVHPVDEKLPAPRLAALRGDLGGKQLKDDLRGKFGRGQIGGLFGGVGLHDTPSARTGGAVGLTDGRCGGAGSGRRLVS